jgi:hypothetical protein
VGRGADGSGGRASGGNGLRARRYAPAWEKILAAVGTTIAVSLTKKLFDLAWNKRFV